MKSLFAWVPNLLTLCNLLCGCMAIVFAADADQMPGYDAGYHNLADATLFVALAMVFDFADGLAARLLGAYSAVGKQLDSLADLVSFGVAPAFVLFCMLDPVHAEYSHWPWGSAENTKYLAFAVAAASALRLARFNEDDSQQQHFVGLPTPANALLVCSLPWMSSTPFHWLASKLYNPYWLLMLGAFACWLPLSRLHFISLKVESLTWSKAKYQYLLLAGGCLLFVLIQWAAVPLFVVWYAAVSFMHSRAGHRLPMQNT